MIEKIIFDYLKATLSVPIYMEVPAKNIPKKFVTIEKTGGGKDNHIGSAILAIQSYAGSLLLSAQLNEVVKDAMENAIVLDEIAKVQLNSDYNFTDTTTKQYRYQAVFELKFY